MTTFVLEGGDSKGGLSQYAGMAAMVGVDLGGGTSGLFQGDNIFELYKSRRMLTQTLLSKTHSDSSELLIERYRSEEHTSELQSLMRISYAVFCLKKKKI